MRKLILLSVSVLLGFQATSQSLTDSLLIHYSFDGNALDQSGNGYDGIINATLASDQFGNLNSAYSFNGTDEYIDFPNDLALKPQLPISVSFWIKFDNLNPENAVFTTNYAQNKHSGIWMSPTSSGQIAIAYGRAIGGSGDPDRRAKLGTTSLQVGTWYLITCVVRGATDMDIYIDCVNDGGTYAGTCTDPIGYTTDAGSIGRKDLSSVQPYYFEGSMNDFRYWNRALNPSDITALCESFAEVEENNGSTQNFHIYPNPSHTTLHVAGANELLHTLKLYDLQGHVVLSTSANKDIDVSSISKGMYILVALDQFGTNLAQEKIVID